MDDDKAKRLRTMRFWLIGVFIIIFAAYITLGFVFPGLLLLRELLYWLALIIVAVLFVIWYLVYKWWLART